jgi:2-iminobutanoate/2-iminopropanoate deaminase
MVYASGNIGCDNHYRLVEGGVQAQTVRHYFGSGLHGTFANEVYQNQQAALHNLSIVLKEAGSGLEHIVKVNVYLTNMLRDFQPMNEAYAEVIAIFVLSIPSK